MKHIHIASVLVLATLAGCGGGGGGYSDSTTPPPVQQPPPPVVATNFTSFTRTQMTSGTSADSGAPVEIETMEWSFPDGEDGTVYDDILAAQQP